jgi:hypothetical protein
MRLEDVIGRAVSRAGVVRVRSALNPFLWCFVWTLAFLVATYLLRDDPMTKYVCLGLAALPLLMTMAIGVFFAFRNPDRLQSEEFVIRQQELTMIEKKGGYLLPPSQVEMDQTPPALPGDD